MLGALFDKQIQLLVLLSACCRRLVVNYINEDAPRAFIRGYIINRRDWVLSPSGNTDWVGKGNVDMDDRQIDVGSKAYKNISE